MIFSNPAHSTLYQIHTGTRYACSYSETK